VDIRVAERGILLQAKAAGFLVDGEEGGWETRNNVIFVLNMGEEKVQSFFDDSRLDCVIPYFETELHWKKLEEMKCFEIRHVYIIDESG